MTIAQWLDARIADVAAREGVNSLITIGSDKPLGTRGFPDWPAAEAGIGLVPPPAKEFRLFIEPWGHWVYMWDTDALPALLDAQAALLTSQGWPTDPADFVHAVRGKPDRSNYVRPRTPLFDLIADAYGDKTNPGRTDCSLAPGALLTLYYKRIGTPDPATIYFSEHGNRVAAKIMRRALRKQGRA